MILELTPYQVFMIAATSIGAMFALAKLIAKQTLTSIMDKLETFKELKETSKAQSQTLANTERDILKLKLDISEQFVRKDDFLRLEKHITEELRALGTKIDNLNSRTNP